MAALALVVFLLGLGGRGRGAARDRAGHRRRARRALRRSRCVIDARGPLFDGAFVVDGLAVFLKQVFLLATLLAVVGGLARPDGRRAPPRPRVPPARPDGAPRDDGPRLGPRARAPLRGVRADVDPALRPGRLRQEGRAGRRGVAQVLPGGEPLDGAPGLRALVRLRRDRQHAARRRDAGGGRAATRSWSSGFLLVLGGVGIQDRRLPVPHVGAGHLRGGGDPVRRVAVGGAEGGGVRRAAPRLRRARGPGRPRSGRGRRRSSAR